MFSKISNIIAIALALIASATPLVKTTIPDTAVKGRLQLLYTGDKPELKGEIAGFIDKTLSSTGRYQIVKKDEKKALNGAVVLQSGGDRTNVYAVNGVHTKTFGAVGAIIGTGSNGTELGSGRGNYLYLVGTALKEESPPKPILNTFTEAEGPGRLGESAIFAVRGKSKILDLYWTNPNDQTIPVFLGSDRSGNLILAGDKVVYARVFKESPTWYDLKFEYPL